MKNPAIILLLVLTMPGGYTSPPLADDDMISYVVDLKKQDLRFYWKDDRGDIFRSIKNLKDHLASKNKKLVFAMNGGMYMEDNSPLGLYIENFKMLRRLNTRSGSGNFYLMPNGVFYITKDNKPVVCATAAYSNKVQVKYATQSGPLLLTGGKIHAAFKEGSANLNIRNGVGILPDGKILFAMSRGAVNFYDFGMFFRKRGCKNALYLDGAVSQTYLPEKDWMQTGGDFAVMIGVAE